VREWAAGFGDDGDGVVEERSPGGVRGTGDEDSTFGESGEIVDAADEEEGPWAWPGLPGRPERREDEVEEVEEGDAGEAEVASAAPVAETSWEEQAPVSSCVITS